MRYESLTTEIFIQRAEVTHGDTYDYSLVAYTGAHNKVKIICASHGVFEQEACEHTQGSGCPICVNICRGEKMLKAKIGEPRECSICKREFPYTDEYFHKHKSTSTGLSCYCKECEVKKCREYRTANPEPCKLSSQKSYEKAITNGSISRGIKRRRANNIGLKITGNLRGEMRYALLSCGGEKITSSLKLVGCSIDDLIKHFESQFQLGMSWNNYGKKGWWIDHIRPCASFNLTDPEQQKECFYYTNLQPMWYKDNIKKSSWYEGRLHYHKKAV